MKKIVLLLLSALLLLFTGCNNGTSLKEIRDRGVLRVGTKVDAKQFGFINPDTNELEGMEIDLARALAKTILGDENAVEFVGTNAKTRGPLLNNGGVDLIIATFTITEERKKLFNFSSPYYVDQIGFMVKNDSPCKSLADMQGLTIGVAQSGTANGALTAESKNQSIEISIKEFASYPEVKAALLNGEIDAFSVDKSILRSYLDDQTMILDFGFNDQHYGIVTKLDNKILAKHVNDFVANIKKNGKLDEIITKWQLK